MRKIQFGALGVAAVAAAAFALPAVMTGTATAAAPAQGVIRNAAAPGVIPGSYIVALKGAPSAKAAVAAQAQAQAQGLVARYGGRLDKVYSRVFRGFAVKATAAQARRMAVAPEVRYVEADALAHATGEQQNPPSWGIDRIDGALNKVYTYPNEGSGATAFVVDTGVDLKHTNFEGRAKSGYDFIDNDSDASDCHGHGTHVAGTVGSKDYGVAKKVSIVAVRVLDCKGSGPFSGVVSGIEWAAKNKSGPAVGNMSLGGPASSSVDDAVKGAAKQGLPFAVAAGNSSTDACTSSPARTPEAITVGATDNSDARSSFSNYGRCLDLFAPGSAIISTKNGGGTTSMNGTSMASPHVAGAVALYLSAHPDATPQQVQDALIAAAQTGAVGNPGSGSPNKLLNVTGLG